MPRTVYILWVDDYHVGDPIFLQSLARTLAQKPSGSLRVLVVHGARERAERLLEAHSTNPASVSDASFVADTHERRLVERATREVNKEVTAVLTDFAVPAVGIQGSDRGIIKQRVDGSLGAGRLSWVHALVETGSVPVVSGLAESGEGPVPVATGDVVILLAESFRADTCVVVVFSASDEAGAYDNGVHLAQVSTLLVEPHVKKTQLGAVKSLCAAGFEVRLTSVRYAISSDSTHFSRISGENTV